MFFYKNSGSQLWHAGNENSLAEEHAVMSYMSLGFHFYLMRAGGAVGTSVWIDGGCFKRRWAPTVSFVVSLYF